MHSEDKFWIAFWALVSFTVSVIAICVTVSSIAEDEREHQEAMSRIEHGCRESSPWVQPGWRHEEEMARIEHGCQEPKGSAP